MLLGSFSVVWTIGYVLASVMGHAWINSDPDAWRWLLASAAFPALLITLLRIGTPESPRWLMRQGRISEAHAVIHRFLGAHVLPGDEIATVTTRHIGALFSSATGGGRYSIVSFYLPRCAMVCDLHLAADYCANYRAGRCLTTSLILNVLLIVGALIGLVLTWSLSRRRFLISSFLLLALTLSVLAFTSASNGTVILFLFVLFSTAISAASSLVGILPAESFPTDIRSLGVGFATAMSRLGAAISTALLPIVLVSWGMRAMLLILVAVLLIGFLVSVLGAETRNLSLVEAADGELKPLEDR
jgi:MFS family permease